MVDPALGGWIHAHENIAITHQKKRLAQVLDIFGDYARPRQVRCEHVEHVKSYAPGVAHYVLDIHVGPLAFIDSPCDGVSP